MSLIHLCPPLPGFPRARGSCWSWGYDGFILCVLLGPVFPYGRLQSSLFSLKLGLCPFASPQHQALTQEVQEVAVGPGALPTSLFRI